MLEPTPTSPQPLVSGSPKGLVDRVRDILIKPKEEWSVIDREPATIQGIYTSYVVILAAIGPIAGLIGNQLLLGVFAPSLVFSVVTAALQYLFSLIGVFVLSLIIDNLASAFGGTKDPVKAFKVAAYASTAIWVVSILNIIPLLGVIAGLAGLVYTAYLLYLGLGPLMRAPADKTVGYAVVCIVAYIVVYFIFAFVVGMLVLTFVGAAVVASAPAAAF